MDPPHKRPRIGSTSDWWSAYQLRREAQIVLQRFFPEKQTFIESTTDSVSDKVTQAFDPTAADFSMDAVVKTSAELAFLLNRLQNQSGTSHYYFKTCLV